MPELLMLIIIQSPQSHFLARHLPEEPHAYPTARSGSDPHPQRLHPKNPAAPNRSARHEQTTP